MPVPEAVIDWLEKQNYGSVTSTHPVGGGCINHGAKLITERGGSFFLKTNTSVPEDMFVCEAAGLKALNIANGPRIPKPYIYGKDFILMEDLTPAPRANNYWEDLGRKLAALHEVENDRFGFDHDNYIGSTPQPNRYLQDGYEFYAQERLLYQVQLARRGGLIEQNQVDRVGALSRKLIDLIPSQPASLIHGDLWSGNAISGPQGEPALIDPAVHYGWAEAELAMTALFGGFHSRFYQAYLEVRPLELGWRDRFEIYNLYHLLNHLNIFGSSYLSQVLSIIRKYT